jgi:protein import protein ZIM17
MMKHEEATLGKETIDAYETKGAVSIMDKLKGTKNTETGELYALMFTCTVCNTRAIRSFTKNAYKNGVVLIRCDGCKKIHLIADNLGWFTDNPTNIEDYA